MLTFLLGVLMLGGLLTFLYKKHAGRIDLSPGEGSVFISLNFCPDEVVVYFTDDDCEFCEECGFTHTHEHTPSCVELVDEITNVRGLPRGLKFDYRIESGVRTIKWKARR